MARCAEKLKNKALLLLLLLSCFVVMLFLLRMYVPLVEFMDLVFTRVPGESYRRRLGSLLLLCLCDVFRALIHSFVC